MSRTNVDDFKFLIIEKKKKWGEGPWSKEPDRVEFEVFGFHCLLQRSAMGAWCGYVALPEGHPFYNLDYTIPDVSVHGGLIYSNVCAGHICHKSHGPDNVWWLGFDCAHYMDYVPEMGSLLNRSFGYDGDVYRDINYVRYETVALAKQLRKADTLWMRIKRVIVDLIAPLLKNRESLRTTLYN